MSKRALCARCHNEVPPRPWKWFSQTLRANGNYRAEVIFKVETKNPRRGRLCLKCTAEVITAASGLMATKLSGIK